jgi:hypothetical protein
LKASTQSWLRFSRWRNQFNYTVNARLQERAVSGASHCEPLFGGTRT